MTYLYVILYVLLAGRAELEIEPTGHWRGAVVSYAVGWFTIPARIIAKVAR